MCGIIRISRLLIPITGWIRVSAWGAHPCGCGYSTRCSLRRGAVLGESKRFNTESTEERRSAQRKTRATAETRRTQGNAGEVLLPHPRDQDDGTAGRGEKAGGA